MDKKELNKDPLKNVAGITGEVRWVLRGPDGEVKQQGVTRNLVTTNGDQYFGQKGRGASPTAMSGMKLGTDATAATKSGTASYIGSGHYISASAYALDSSSPKAGTDNSKIEYDRTWAAGQATNATINEVSIVDNTTDAAEADATHTLARAVLSPTVNKGANDSLQISWVVTFLGA